TEESLFRGDLQPTLQRMLGRGAGLLFTALVFAAYHLRFGLWGLLGKTAFGLVFGILRERTGPLGSRAVRGGPWPRWGTRRRSSRRATVRVGPSASATTGAGGWCSSSSPRPSPRG